MAGESQSQYFVNKLMLLLMAGLFGRKITGGGLFGDDAQNDLSAVTNSGSVANQLIGNGYKDLGSKSLFELKDYKSDADKKHIDGINYFVSMAVNLQSGGNVKDVFAGAKTPQEIYAKFPDAQKPNGQNNYASGDVVLYKNQKGNLDLILVNKVEGDQVTITYTQPKGLVGRPEVFQEQVFALSQVEKNGQKINILTSKDGKLKFEQDGNSLVMDKIIEKSNPDFYKKMHDDLNPKKASNDPEIPKPSVAHANVKGEVSIPVIGDDAMPKLEGGIKFAANQAQTGAAQLFDFKGGVNARNSAVKS